MINIISIRLKIQLPKEKKLKLTKIKLTKIKFKLTEINKKRILKIVLKNPFFTILIMCESIDIDLPVYIHIHVYVYVFMIRCKHTNIHAQTRLHI